MKKTVDENDENSHVKTVVASNTSEKKKKTLQRFLFSALILLRSNELIEFAFLPVQRISIPMPIRTTRLCPRNKRENSIDEHFFLFFLFEDPNQRFSSNMPRRRTSSIDSNERFPMARRDRWRRFIRNRWSIARVSGTKKKVFISGKTLQNRAQRRRTCERKGNENSETNRTSNWKSLDCGTSARRVT